MPEALSAAQEAAARLRAERIGQAVQEEFLQVARTLAGGVAGSFGKGADL